MITVENFMSAIKQNESRVTHYQSGGDGSGDGGCDCIGLIIGAMRLAGPGWKGTHGSNYAARNTLQEGSCPFKIKSENDLEYGMVVFKTRRPGDSGYNLPDSYKNSGDLTDYYHVGVVAGVNPLQIDHCTKSSTVDGMTTDTKLGNWSHYGHMKSVDFGMMSYKDGKLCSPELPWIPWEEPEQKVQYQAKVVAESGSTVNMRKSPDRSSEVLYRVPLGTIVDVYFGDAEWHEIKYKNQHGYMMTKFLSPIIDFVPDSNGDGFVGVDVSNSDKAQEKNEYKDALENAESALKQAENALESVTDALEQIKKLLER